MKILVVNAGSSSYKLALYEILNKDPISPLWRGEIEWGREKGGGWAQAGEGKKVQFSHADVSASLSFLIQTLWTGETQVIADRQAIERIAHRVVHGGRRFYQPTLITQEVKEEIRRLMPLAPLHNPLNLEGIEHLERLFPSTPQVAIFDTAFHHAIPEVAQTYPVPYAWKEKGIQRYGFHGISHHYCAERVAALLQQERFKMINCHLGNGSSLCAIRDGKSVETTMGFTPLEGLMMGNRSGSIDPGIIFYLLREKSYTAEELDHILNFESGLKGISGFSDMREILEHPSPLAQLAVEMFVYRLKFYIGALAAVLGGVDVIAFTAGIGENAAKIREATCQGLEFLGAHLDLTKNLACRSDQDLASPQSKIHLFVIHTQEEWMMAWQSFLFK